MDGPIFINFEPCSCPDGWASIAFEDDDTTIKVATFEEEIDDAGVDAVDDVIGRAFRSFLFPFVISKFVSISFPASIFSFLLITSASSNSSKGLTGNK